MDSYTGKMFCILGDSISTFAGYTPEGAVFYDAWFQRVSGVRQVQQTWWMQVVDGLGGTMGVNDAYSGSTVAGGLPTSGCAVRRHLALGARGMPDVILIFMGYNDWAYGVALEEFSEAYGDMLASLMRLYPAAEIWCGTLMRGQLAHYGAPVFFNAEGCSSQESYNAVICRQAAAQGCRVALLADAYARYDAVDEVHPDQAGMRTIAAAWLRAMGQEGS